MQKVCIQVDKINRQQESSIVSAKDKDLTVSLPIEGALEIFWDAENDVIRFKVDLKDQPMTRRDMLSVISPIYDPLGLACPFLLQGRRLHQGLCQVMHG